jgi:hypothetical protein
LKDWLFYCKDKNMITFTWKEKQFKDRYKKEFKNKKEADVFEKKLKSWGYNYERSGKPEPAKKSKEIVKDIMSEYWKKHPK